MNCLDVNLDKVSSSPCRDRRGLAAAEVSQEWLASPSGGGCVEEEEESDKNYLLAWRRGASDRCVAHPDWLNLS
ncbi:hypothetical protein E2C01_071537 [Portunus trituberculatus]|uniref:Uncharacterized protein n=1 Tax=Portunus trituberculatus TaxID=210409 RepID=A0A5B7I071_PORTR|nr:hypothetical protein [Portunus trituberculatus]